MSKLFALLKRQFLLLKAKDVVLSFLFEMASLMVILCCIKFDSSMPVSFTVGFYCAVYFTLILPRLNAVSSMASDLKNRKNSTWNRNLSIAPVSSYLILFSYFLFSFIYLLLVKVFVFTIFLISFGVKSIYFAEIGWIIFYVLSSAIYITVYVNFISFMFYNNIKIVNILTVVIGLVISYAPFVIQMLVVGDLTETTKWSRFEEKATSFLPTKSLIYRLFMTLKMVFAHNESGITCRDIPFPYDHEELEEMPWQKKDSYGYNDTESKQFLSEKLRFLQENFLKIFSITHEIIFYVFIFVLILIVCLIVFTRDEKTYTK